jgi:hypothetical protein
MYGDHECIAFIPSAPEIGIFGRWTRKKEQTGIKSGLREFLPVSNPVQGKGMDVLDSQEQVRFETLVLPHLDAAFNLARWLLRSRG